MSEDVNQDVLKKILVVHPSQNILATRESTRVEFKESFNFNDIAEYLRDFAAFANNKGGYMVFGVENSPHFLKGVDEILFDSIDEEKITGFINEHFSPALDWDKLTVEVSGVHLGVIYIYEHTDRPVIAIKDGGRNQEIKNGEIYFRYHGRSQKIRFSELRKLIDLKLEKERKAWQEHVERMVRIGPTNAAILDTVQGKIESSSGTILIDDELIPKLKFIREGQFVENNGKPTLKLVGDLKPASVIQRVVHDDPYIYKATDVAAEVESKLRKKFKVNNHTAAWRFFKIREDQPDGTIKCDKKYADYKATINYVLYNRAWINFLCEELKNVKVYKRIVK